MKYPISKKPIGSSMTYRKPKFNKFRVLPFVLLTSIFLLAASPYPSESENKKTITFTPSMQVSGNSEDFIQGRVLSSHRGYLKLLANSDNSNYTTDFYFNENASLGLDPGYDAGFFNDFVPDFAIYSHLVENNNGTPFAIQTLGGNDINNVTIPLGLHASQGQPITISISETDIPPSIKIYLEDSETNTFTLLNAASYSFTTIEDITGTGRFYLRFENSALGIEESILDDLSIYNNYTEKTIVIKGAIQNNTTIKLYNINGREVLTDRLTNANTKHTINVEYLTAGVYILELVNTANAKRIEKLVIK